jgi:hypothetical protein
MEDGALRPITKELDSVLDLSLPFGIRPVKLLSHDFDDARESVERCAGVEEGEPGTPGEYVDGGYGIFVPDCVAHFCV